MLLLSLNQWEPKHKDAICSVGVFPMKMTGYLEIFLKQPLKVTESCLVDVAERNLNPYKGTSSKVTNDWHFIIQKKKLFAGVPNSAMYSSRYWS